MRTSPTSLQTLYLVCLGAALLVGLAAAGGGYSLSIDDSTTVPEQTVTVDGEEYDISAIAVRERNEELVVDATVPDEDSVYYVELRNSDNQIVQSEDLEGSDSTSLATDREPGSYVVVLDDNGFQAIHPLVIAAYDVDLSIPDEIDTDSSATATVTLQPFEDSDEPHEVEVIIGDDDRNQRVTAERVSDGTYEAELQGDALPEGDYQAYAIARSNEEVEDGENEIVGVSDGHVVTYTSEPSGSDDGAGTGGGGDDGEPSDDDQEATPTSTPDGTVTPTATPGDDDGQTTDDSTGDTGTATPTPAGDDSVITPREESPTEPEADGAAPTVAVVLGVLAGLGIWFRRRSRKGG